MKYYPIFGIILLSLFSCKKDKDEAPGFDMLIQTDFEIPAGISTVQTHHFVLNNLETKYKTLLQESGKTDAEISGIRCTAATLNTAFGDARLDFISRTWINAIDEDDPNDKMEVAYRDPAPLDSGNNLGYIPSLVDLKPMLGKTQVTLDLVFFNRYSTNESIPVRLDLRFRAIYSE